MKDEDQQEKFNDDELLKTFRKTNDNKWLGILLQRYTLLLLGVAYKYLQNKTLAEDAVQQVFLKALTNLPMEDIHNFKGWLYILMRNQCLQQLREKNRVTGGSINIENSIVAAEDTGQLKWQEYSLRQVNEALAELNEEQRKAIELFYLKQFSYEQIIKQTGFTFIQVKSHIQNGKRNLKNILTKKLGKYPL